MKFIFFMLLAVLAIACGGGGGGGDSAPQKPDLSLGNVDGSSYANGSTINVSIGEILQAQVRIHNNGTVEAPAGIQLRISSTNTNEVFNTTTDQAIQPGSYLDAYGDYEITSSDSGPVTFTITIDPENLVDESNESNNQMQTNYIFNIQ